MNEDTVIGTTFGTAGAWLVIALVCGGLYGCPQYNIYSSRLSGEAELARSEFSKRVAVTSSQAKLDAAHLEAQTDIVRAEGIAKANSILSNSLGGPEGYLRWKYIEMLENTAHSKNQTTIYIPTEAGIPILEAGRTK